MAKSGTVVAQPELRRVLSVETAKAIETYVESTLRGERARTRVADLLVADGVWWENIASPPKGHDDDPLTIAGNATTWGEFHAEIKSDIVAGFNATTRALLDTPTKGLSDEQKAEKRYWQQQIGSKQKDIRNAVKRRQVEDEGPGANHARPIDVRIVEFLNQAKSLAQKDESPTYNVTTLVIAIDGALDIATTPVKPE